MYIKILFHVKILVSKCCVLIKQRNVLCYAEYVHAEQYTEDALIYVDISIYRY
jgi:hypothetical protein